MLFSILLGSGIGLIPGGNPILTCWIATAMGFSPEHTVLATVITFPVSYIKNHDPKVSGNINGMIADTHSSATKTVKEGLVFFCLAFSLAGSLIYLPVGAFLIKTIPSVTLLAICSSLYVKGGERSYLETFLSILIVGAGSLAIFGYAKEVQIANPIYITSMAVFFPWERLFEKSKRVKPKGEDKSYNSDLVITIPFTTLLTGWNAGMTPYLLPNKRKGNRESPSSRQLLTSGAISEGFALGFAVTINRIMPSDRIGGYSSILEPLKGQSIPLVDFLDPIALGVFLGGVIGLILSQLNFSWDKLYQSKESQWVNYGIMAGTAIGNAGWFSLPIIIIGFLIHLALKKVADWDPLLSYRDPSLSGRAKTTLFIYPIILL